MNFAEALTKAIEKTKEKDDGFFFQLIVLGAEKAGPRKKVATMKLQIDDKVAEHIFDNLDKEIRFGICIPREIWDSVMKEVKETNDQIARAFAKKIMEEKKVREKEVA